MKRSTTIVALLSVSVALLAASASFSIAWYATSANLYVESIRIGADPERTLLISTEKESDYKPDLRHEDLHSVGLFTPVTLACSSTWEGELMPCFYDMSHSYGFPGDPVLFDASPDGYFSQEVFLKADDDVYAGIDAEASFAKPDEEKNAEYAVELTLNEGLTQDDAGFNDRVEEWKARLDDVKYCARIGVYVDGKSYIFDPNANEDVPAYYAGALDNDNDRYFDYYQDPDTNELYEVCYGEIKAGHSRDELVYLDPLDADSPLVGEPTAFNAKHKEGVHRLDLAANDAILVKEPRLTPSDLAKEVAMPELAFSMDAYTPKRVVVSFYLEGWDRDSINAAMGASFQLNLSFKIIRER